MLQVLSCATNDSSLQKAKRFFKLKSNPKSSYRSYEQDIIESIRHTCRFDWLLIERVQLGEQIVDYVLVGPKGVYLLFIHRHAQAVHVTNRFCKIETTHGWKQVVPHPIERANDVARSTRALFKGFCGLAVPVNAITLYPNTVHLRTERLQANCSTDFSFINHVVNRTKKSILSETTVKQVAYYCATHQGNVQRNE